MGHKYEVYGWRLRNLVGHFGEYHYQSEYEGKSLLRALYVMCRLKWSGIGCVKMEWR